jgi:hypothetical protein
VRRLLVTASVVPSKLILLTLMMEELISSETSVLTTANGGNIQENAILNIPPREFNASTNSGILILILEN